MRSLRRAAIAAALLVPTVAVVAAAQSNTTISLKPNCGPAGTRTQVTVTGAGFYPYTPGDIYFDSETRVGGFTPDANGSFSASVTLPPTKAGTHSVLAVNEDDDFGTTANTTSPKRQATAPFDVPCPQPATTISLEPSCGPADTRAQVTVTGAGFLSNRDGDIYFDNLNRRVGGFTTNASGSFSTTVTLPATTAGTHSVIAVNSDVDRGARRAAAPFGVPCRSSTETTKTTDTSVRPPVVIVPPPPGPAPALRADPPIGPPGFVTSVVGTGFTPDTDVTLRWDPGLGTATVRTDADGRFRTPLLVFDNDRLGPRDVVAQGPTSEVRAPFLVVPGRGEPPRFVFRS